MFILDFSQSNFQNEKHIPNYLSRITPLSNLGFFTVKISKAAMMETHALIKKAVLAPNFVQTNPNQSEAGKTVIPKARL